MNVEIGTEAAQFPEKKHINEIFLAVCRLQRKPIQVPIPLLGIARPQSQFPHSCVCEGFIYALDLPTKLPSAK
jgi:hypothetical protein